MRVRQGDTVLIGTAGAEEELQAIDGMQGSVVSVEIEETEYDGEMWHIWIRVPEMGNELYCLNESEVEVI